MGSSRKRKNSDTTSEPTSSSSITNSKKSKAIVKGKKKRKEKNKRKKKKYISSSSTGSSSSSSSQSDSESSLSQDERGCEPKRKKAVAKLKEKSKKKNIEEDVSADVPIALMEKSRTMAPMTKEQWEKQQSVVRKVYDETTGRYRLIKGDGEVIEEIVSKERHKEINKQATTGDGQFFHAKLYSKATKY